MGEYLYVIRWENDSGHGPYTSSAFMTDYLAEKYSLDDHPPPREEPNIIGINPHEYCGFISRQQEERWFDHDDRQKLKEHGYHRTLYKVPIDTVRVGDKQCVFSKSGSELIGTQY